MIKLCIFYSGFASFVLAMIIHIVVWRTLRPSRQLVWLLSIFVAGPIASYTVAFFLNSDPGWHFLVLAALVWNLALSGAYIMTYPPIQASCPSLRIMLAVSSAVGRGMSLEEISRIFSNDILVFDRVDDLVRDGLLSLQYGSYRISMTGRLLSFFFTAYRRILRLPMGEG